MKKGDNMRRIFNGLGLLIFTLALILCFPQSVRAKEDLVIPQWVVEASLDETGDLHIAEDITFEYNKKFNGVFREILLGKTSGVSGIRVQELGGAAPKEYTQVDHAEKGDSGVFLIKDTGDTILIQIFSPAKDQEKTFRISYLVKNVAIKYNDIGELYYKFIGAENETPIESLTINIKLPQADTGNEVKVFAHGPLNGKITKENNTEYSLFVEDVPKGTFIEGRILFPREFIPLSGNVQNIDNYTYILEEEAAFQNKQIADRERKEKIGRILKRVSSFASSFGVVLFLIFLIHFRREKNIYQSEQPADAIPDDCTPAIAALLTNTMIGTNTILATMLDLMRKGYIKITGDDKSNLKSADQEFVITLVKKADNSLLNHERFFINWLIYEIGNGQSVSTKEIEEFGKSNSSKFGSLYYEWQSKIREDAVLKGYYDKSKTKYGVFSLITSLALFILGIFTLVYGSLVGLANLIISIALFIFGLTLFYRLSDSGYHHYKKWVDFKKNMKQNKKGFAHEKPVKYASDISAIYALGLGVEKKPGEFNFGKGTHQGTAVNDGSEIYSTNSWVFWYLMFVSNKNNAFEKSIDNSFGGATGSHSGGGFSGGGGGGAGGGGAGGF